MDFACGRSTECSHAARRTVVCQGSVASGTGKYADFRGIGRAEGQGKEVVESGGDSRDGVVYSVEHTAAHIPRIVERLLRTFIRIFPR